MKTRLFKLARLNIIHHCRRIYRSQDALDCIKKLASKQYPHDRIFFAGPSLGPTDR
jgi:hypothetical protein